MLHKAAPENFFKQNTVLRKILDNIYDAVYIVDKNRKIIFWNKGAKKIIGYEKREVEGKRCSDNILNHIDVNGVLLCKTSACPLSKVFKTGKTVSMKVYPLTKKKKRLPVETNISPIRDEKGNIIAAIEIFRDISVTENYRILQEKFHSLIKRYVSSSTYKDVVEQAQSDNKNLSRVCDLTVVFIDIVGFTAYSEVSPHDEVVGMLNDLFGICEICTRENQGDIDKFIGDAVMAVFVDANDAINASIKIINSIKKMNIQRNKDKKHPISVRIGINSGKLIQGDIGGIDRKDSTVIGDVVNTSSRIQGIADPNCIIISESTYARINKSADFKFKDRVNLKGKKNKISVFQWKHKK